MAVEYKRWGKEKFMGNLYIMVYYIDFMFIS
jgi:hypothetical protein